MSSNRRYILLVALTAVCWASPAWGGGIVFIPGGEFQMGDGFAEGPLEEQPVHAVYVSPFYMDRYEVTNAQYAAGLNWAWAQGGLIRVATDGVVYKAVNGTSFPYCDTDEASSYHFSRITWDGSTFGVVAGKEDHPMVKVSWYGAVAYCNWRSAMEGKPLCYDLSTWTCDFGVAGYRLPTEAEWERAARGGVAGRRFPWSDQNTIQHTRCNYFSTPTDSYDTSSTRYYHPLWGVGHNMALTSPVGFFTGAIQYKADWGWPGSPTSYQTVDGANGYGLYDMAGNVAEWCYDWFDGTYYSSSPYSNPVGPPSGTVRVRRGGGYTSGAVSCRVTFRLGWPGPAPSRRMLDSGFRCAAGADCNANGIIDELDIASGFSEDCDANGVPDECQADADGDGLIDPCDACPESDSRETIIIDGCDTGVANQMPWNDGCTMADQIDQCADDAGNHGAFVHCVAQLADAWKKAGLITGREKGQIQRCAAQARIGSPPLAAPETIVPTGRELPPLSR